MSFTTNPKELTNRLLLLTEQFKRLDNAASNSERARNAKKAKTPQRIFGHIPSDEIKKDDLWAFIHRPEILKTLEGDDIKWNQTTFDDLPTELHDRIFSIYIEEYVNTNKLTISPEMMTYALNCIKALYNFRLPADFATRTIVMHWTAHHLVIDNLTINYKKNEPLPDLRTEFIRKSFIQFHNRIKESLINTHVLDSAHDIESSQTHISAQSISFRYLPKNSGS